MTATIGNPLSWGALNLGAAEGVAVPRVRHIATDDLRAALKAGWAGLLR